MNNPATGMHASQIFGSCNHDIVVPLVAYGQLAAFCSGLDVLLSLVQTDVFRTGRPRRPSPPQSRDTRSPQM